MQAIKRDIPGSDEDLAARAAEGDQSAFAELYERYFDEVFDLAARTARDPELGPDIVQSAFTTAWDRLRKGRAGSNIGPWLYTIARKKAIEGLRKLKPVPAGGGVRDSGKSPFTQLDATSTASEKPDELTGFDQETVETVWNSASALRPKQYSLLDLHLRRGLSADELAESLGLSRQSVYTMLSRLRLGLTDSVTGSLLARRGWRECRSLGELLNATEASGYTREVRQIIHSHLKECEACRAFRRRLSSPLEVFSALALVPAPPGVKAVAWRGISSHMNGLAIPLPRGRLPRPLDAMPTRTTLPLVAVGIAGVMGIIAVLVAGVLVFGSSGGGTATIEDPGDIRATDRVLGEPSADNTIEVGWTAVPGAQAYSVDWTEDEDDLPDTEADLEGTATSATSPSLDPGDWYFHLRTQGGDGNWTSTVHLGPFEIINDVRPSASPTTSPSPTPSGTPPPEPRFPTETAAPATETPTPVPEPTATPTLTPTPAPPAPTDTPASSPTTTPTNGAEGT